MLRNGVIAHAPHLAQLLADAVAAAPNRDLAERDQDTALADRASGVLLGLAAGNLLGLPVEGAWHHEIASWRSSGLTSLTEIDPREATQPMDDDLAQAVELGEALLSGGDYIHDFANRLVRWERENGRGMGFTTGEVIRRLRGGVPSPDAARLVYERQGRIAPNGGVMRCAPVAVARRTEPALLVSDSAATCAVTHYAPTCQWSCIIINAVVAMLLDGATPDLRAIVAAAKADGCPDLASAAHSDGIPADVFDAIAAGRPVPPDISWLLCDHHLIGHTLLALQAGLWAAATPLNLEDALVDMVSAGGDTDTNAAVAGAVLGARYGASAIPQRWIDCIPQRERIERLADGLFAMVAA